VVIVWSRLAREDLRHIHQYIAHDSPRYATRVIQDIVGKVEGLKELPRLGRVVPEIGEENIRELGMYSYRIMYELMGDTIYIHGVIQRRRDFKPEHINQPGSS
jgi:plasmid stabilization system protein ParE